MLGVDKMQINKKVKLELVGLDGNAFCLMSAFQRQARKEGWTQEEISFVLNECKAGDYDHLLQTLLKYTDSPAEDEDAFMEYAKKIFEYNMENE